MPRPYAASASVCSSSLLTGDSVIRPRRGKDYYDNSYIIFFPPIFVQLLFTRLGRKPEDSLKLDANENPYGPQPEALEALGSIRFPYIYPDPESRSLRAALAEDYGLESDYIQVGCDPDELIDLIMRCPYKPGDKIVYCPPTSTMNGFDAGVNAEHVVKVPRKSDFSLDVERIVEVVEQEKPKCIFLTSPNTPNGSISDDETLMKILNLPILVYLDEAYMEFSGIESKMTWVKKFENLIVLRTFSKRAGIDHPHVRQRDEREGIGAQPPDADANRPRQSPGDDTNRSTDERADRNADDDANRRRDDSNADDDANRRRDDSNADDDDANRQREDSNADDDANRRRDANADDDANRRRDSNADDGANAHNFDLENGITSAPNDTLAVHPIATSFLSLAGGILTLGLSDSSKHSWVNYFKWIGILIGFGIGVAGLVVRRYKATLGENVMKGGAMVSVNALIITLISSLPLKLALPGAVVACILVNIGLALM